MRQGVGRAVQAFASAIGDGLSEMLCIPIDDDCGEEVLRGSTKESVQNSTSIATPLLTARSTTAEATARS